MHSQYKSVPQNDHQHETEKGDDEDDEDDEEDSEDDGSDDDILAVYGSDSEDEDSHEESGKDESDDMNVPQNLPHYGPKSNFFVDNYDDVTGLSSRLKGPCFYMIP
ncbi:hypothetical protein AWC38_SpisGene18552 [Stylophora pistillata]|uniref:Uncharacterized protein n=1 Tax=Stylophora pistillata TaxID=50429 RepID=A0A2B4RLB7_STYPI|nr:hypothetical protein AWC38_SpisGene18552 [Stylophora pistillata]